MQSKANILIADDNPDICSMLRIILTERGYAVETVRNGYEALTSVKEKPPHVLILDLMMPEKSGIDIFSAVKGVSPTTKIVIYTALEEYENSAYARKADKFLLKGTNNPDELIRAIEELT